MIEARHLTKRYGQTVAVDDASFVVRPGRVTGFLDPNGAGKPDLGNRHFFGLWGTFWGGSRSVVSVS
jgi:ABC-type branched-subunit amino acid transport system ATPase component